MMLESLESRLNKLKVSDGREIRRFELIGKFFGISQELLNHLGADTSDAEYTPGDMQWKAAVERLKVLKDHIQFTQEVLQSNKQVHEHFLDRIEKKLNLLGSKSDD